MSNLNVALLLALAAVICFELWWVTDDTFWRGVHKTPYTVDNYKLEGTVPPYMRIVEVTHKYTSDAPQWSLDYWSTYSCSYLGYSVSEWKRLPGSWGSPEKARESAWVFYHSKIDENTTMVVE